LPRGRPAPAPAARGLTRERRPVEGAFAGDDEIRLGKCGVEAYAFQHPRGSRHQPGLGEEREARAEPAGGTATGKGPELRPTMAPHQLRPALEPTGQELHPFGARTFLRGK